MAASLYALSAVQQTIDTWIEAGGQVDTVKEGVLGWGLTICHGEGLKTAVITEVPLNEWSSAHTIRIYNKMPKKYQAMLEEFENRRIEEEEEKVEYSIVGEFWDAEKEEYYPKTICKSENYNLMKKKFDRISSEKLTNDMPQVCLEKDTYYDCEKLFESCLMEGGEVYTYDF